MDIRETVKMLLPDVDDKLLGFTASLVEDSMKNYCHVESVPDGLNNVAAAMVVDALRQHQFGKSELEPEVKGVSRMDASFSFASASEQMQRVISNPGFTQNYKAQLNAYRKLRW